MQTKQVPDRWASYECFSHCREYCWLWLVLTQAIILQIKLKIIAISGTNPKPNKLFHQTKLFLNLELSFSQLIYQIKSKTQQLNYLRF